MATSCAILFAAAPDRTLPGVPIDTSRAASPVPGLQRGRLRTETLPPTHLYVQYNERHAASMLHVSVSSTYRDSRDARVASRAWTPIDALSDAIHDRAAAASLAVVHRLGDPDAAAHSLNEVDEHVFPNVRSDGRAAQAQARADDGG